MFELKLETCRCDESYLLFFVYKRPHKCRRHDQRPPRKAAFETKRTFRASCYRKGR